MDIMEVISQLGFPAAVAAYALWNSYKHEQYLQDTLTDNINKNTQALTDIKIVLSKISKIEVGDKDDAVE